MSPRHAAPSPPQFADYLRIDWRKNSLADHPIFYLDTLIKTGSWSIEATLRRRRILFAGFVARMGDTRLRDVRRIGGGRGLREGHDKEWMGCFLGDLGAFGITAD